jgi:predicted nucleic acid-binding protein
MPTGGRRDPRELLVDTSVAVALVVADHEHHTTVTRAVGRRRLGLAGHAAFETFSVLTRLPTPARRAAREVSRLLRSGFPASRFLGAGDAEALLRRLPDLGIAGGAVYDALVGSVAVAHGLPLATRDLRAVDVYRVLDVELELVAEPAS